jgi:Escherichia/Staphylococcus phage prohead protease
VKREYRATRELELRQEPGESLKIRGYAAVFNQLSEPLFGFRERILPGAFKKSIDADVRALVGHDPSQIIGRTKSKTLILREDDHGLYTEIDPPNTQLGRDTVESIKRGDLDQMSFGFQVVKDEWKHEERELVRELVDVDLFDVSVVAFPAYTQTEVSVRSLWPDGIPEEVEKIRNLKYGPPITFRVPMSDLGDLEKTTFDLRDLLAERIGQITNAYFQAPVEERQEGFQVQSLIFPKKHWDSAAECKAWAKEHDFNAGSVDETDEMYRIRQADPDDFVRLRTICINPGDAAADSDKCRVKAVGGPMKRSLYREKLERREKEFARK